MKRFYILLLASCLLLSGIACTPEPPPRADQLVQVSFENQGKMLADGASTMQITVQLPVGSQATDITLSTTQGTLAAATLKSDPVTANATFFLVSDTKPGFVRVTALAGGFTKNASIEFTRSCPEELAIRATDLRVAANGNNSTQITVEGLRFTKNGKPSEGLPIEVTVTRKDKNTRKSAGTLTYTGGKNLNAQGQVSLNLRAGQDKGFVLLTVKANCAEVGGTPLVLQKTIEIEFI